MSIKKITHGILSLFLLLAACKRVPIELPDSFPYPLVVEAAITDLAPSAVTISRVARFDEPDTAMQYFEGALVTITNEAGFSEILQESLPGRYTGAMFAEKGRSYTLSIVAGEDTFSSKATAAAVRVTIDSFTYLRTDTATMLKCHFKLPPVRPVYLTGKLKLNGQVYPANLLYESSTFSKNQEVWVIDFSYVEEGAKAEVELLTVTKPAFEYHRALLNNVVYSSHNTANAKNPSGNIEGGAIGFFTAALADTASVTIW